MAERAYDPSLQTFTAPAPEPVPCTELGSGLQVRTSVSSSVILDSLFDSLRVPVETAGVLAPSSSVQGRVASGMLAPHERRLL